MFIESWRLTNSAKNDILRLTGFRLRKMKSPKLLNLNIFFEMIYYLKIILLLLLLTAVTYAMHLLIIGIIIKKNEHSVNIHKVNSLI